MKESGTQDIVKHVISTCIGTTFLLLCLCFFVWGLIIIIIEPTAIKGMIIPTVVIIISISVTIVKGLTDLAKLMKKLREDRVS